MELAQLLDSGRLEQSEEPRQSGTDPVVVEGEIRELFEFTGDPLVRILLLEQSPTELILVKLDAIQTLERK